MIDDALKALVVAGEPSAKDMAFELAIMARIERHQFRRALLVNAAVSVALALVLAFAAPALQQIWQTELTANGSLLLGVGLLFASYLMLRLTYAES